MKTYDEVKKVIHKRCRIEVVKTQLNHMLSLILYLVENDVERDYELLARIDTYLEDIYNRYIAALNDETQDIENHSDDN